MTTTKLDENTTIPVRLVFALLALVATGVAAGAIFWVRLELRMNYEEERHALAIATIEKTIASADLANREGLREVKDELRRIGSESVSVRQMTVLMELMQMTASAWVADLRAKNPTMHVGDIKLPLLPR